MKIEMVASINDLLMANEEIIFEETGIIHPWKERDT